MASRARKMLKEKMGDEEIDHKIRSAFDQIQAEDSLKRETKDFYPGSSIEGAHPHSRRIVVSAACFLAALLGLGGYFSYVTPVSAVSIDVNPSIELEINLFNKVIDVIGYNDDGAELADSLAVRHMDYLDAVNAILEDQTITACLLEDNLFGNYRLRLVGGKSRRNARLHCFPNKRLRKTRSTAPTAKKSPMRTP